MGDDFVASRLKDWGLEKYTDDFRAKGITQAVLPLLLQNPQTIDSLFPVLGDKLLFLHHSELNNNNNDLFNLPIVIESEPSMSSASSTNSFLLPVDASLSLSSSRSASDSPSAQSMRLLLELSGYGTSVLSLTRLLRLKERKTICDIVINHHLRDNIYKRISSSQFVSFSEDLEQLFPKDKKSLWYSPRIPSNGLVGAVNAKGELLKAYYRARRDYAEIFDENASDDEEDDDLQEEISDSVAGELKWLESNFEPWASVEEKWTNTRNARKSMRDAKSYKPTQYLDQFKILRQPTGHLLIQSDFEFMHPEKAGNLFKNLDTFLTKAYEQLKTVRPRARELSNVLKTQDLLIKSNGQFNPIVILMSLNYLVPIHTVSKKKVKGVAEEIKGWRPSRQEVQNGFITHIDDVSKLNETVTKRDQQLLSVKLTRQPFVILVGRDLDHITSSYVCINDFFYLLNSPNEAIDVCFKCVFALKMDYSIQSRPLWLLLQTSVYEVFTSYDRSVATASALSLLARFGVELTI